MFFWIVATRCLPAGYALAKRGLVGNEECILCNVALETEFRLFFSVPCNEGCGSRKFSGVDGTCLRSQMSLKLSELSLRSTWTGTS